jgi:hypothetical protein
MSKQRVYRWKVWSISKYPEDIFVWLPTKLEQERLTFFVNAWKKWMRGRSRYEITIRTLPRKKRTKP